MTEGRSDGSRNQVVITARSLAHIYLAGCLFLYVLSTGLSYSFIAVPHLYESGLVKLDIYNYFLHQVLNLSIEA